MTTIADVAKAAGVSISTVSYVMSGKRTISAETRERVARAIAAKPRHRLDELGAGVPMASHPLTVLDRML